MSRSKTLSAIFILFYGLLSPTANCQTISIDTQMSPPEWALLQRLLLTTNAKACEEFYEKYFDERGFLLCVERWGGDDGPDDAMECFAGWPMLHALGASDNVRRLYRKGWEGHLRQFTLAKTTHVPFAKDGMYYKEFPCMFDWQHNNEGLLPFHLFGLSEPYARRYLKRLRRYAGFYMNEDSGAANYDPKQKIIRSMFNGSRGPLLRKATGLDWAGDPIEVEHRFLPRHGEETYEQMLTHFKDYTDIVGDHPMNLQATSLAMNAYMITGEQKYKDWILEYVDAWLQRMVENDDIIPSNVGLDGTLGGGSDGKWYGGTYGWGFTVVVPQDGSLANRNIVHYGFTGFVNAYLLTGDDKYLAAWRRQRDKINSQMKMVDGQPMYPRMFGAQGWYAFSPQRYAMQDQDIFFLAMTSNDQERVMNSPWVQYLSGKNIEYPTQILQRDLAAIRSTVKAMRNDTTTPDTRLSDDPLRFNPVRIEALNELMQGGLRVTKSGALLHCRLRYFDPVNRRAGVPDDVAALVEKMTDRTVEVSIVNCNQLETRKVVVQAGAYAEHQFESATLNGKTIELNCDSISVRLDPGSGGKLSLKMKRYSNQPRLKFPWGE